MSENQPDERVNGLGLPAWENPETGVLETRPEAAEEAAERTEDEVKAPRADTDENVEA